MVGRRRCTVDLLPRQIERYDLGVVSLDRRQTLNIGPSAPARCERSLSALAAVGEINVSRIQHRRWRSSMSPSGKTIMKGRLAPFMRLCPGGENNQGARDRCLLRRRAATARSYIRRKDFQISSFDATGCPETWKDSEGNPSLGDTRAQPRTASRRHRRLAPRCT
ncbi:hypothetical protein ANRL2_04345 [Anaerolineae bacterium]|nr:hypothetical protein ANRL2_04345 [Anaerolineae bacterium]